MTYCEQCRKDKKKPPCGTCEFASPTEPLLPENESAWELWMSVHSQWRGAGMGVIGIDHHAVRAAAKELEIEMSPCMWGKINTLEQLGLKHINKRPYK